MKSKKVIYLEANYGDLERAVRTIYEPKTEWEFPEDHEANNYSYYTFIVNGILNGTEESRLSLWTLDNSGMSGMTHILLNDMCRRGLIEAGNYLIEVFW